MYITAFCIYIYIYITICFLYNMAFEYKNYYMMNKIHTFTDPRHFLIIEVSIFVKQVLM